MGSLFGGAFYESVQRDPLFAAEGMDLERGVAALSLLRERLREFHALVAKGSPKLRLQLFFHPLDRALYPLPFLDAFLESERARREFLAVPSERAAKQLLKAWRKSAALFGKSAKRHRRLLDVALASDPLFRGKKAFYDKVGNSFTLADVYRDADLLIENAARLTQEVQFRADLLADPSLSFEPIADEAIAAGTAAISETGRMMEELNTARHAKESILLGRFGPHTLRLPHFDAGVPTERQFFTYILQHREQGYAFVRVEPADRFYFLPLTKEAFGWMGDEIFRTAIARKVPYWMQTGTRFYCLRDQQYWADAMTLVDFERRSHLDREALMRQRSSMLDLLLMTCVEEVVNQIYNAKARLHHGSSTYSFGPLVLAHSHLSIYYLPFNRSVWRMPERALFMATRSADRALSIYKTIEEVLPELARKDFVEMIEGGMNRVADWKAQGII